jgi:Hypothetical glycosyl hydrolase family 15
MPASRIRAIKRRALPAAIATTAALALAASAAQASTSTVFGPALGASQAPIAASFNRTTYRYQSTLPIAQEASLYKVIVLQSTDAKLVPALRAANPNLKIFVYQDGFLGRSTDPTGITACTKYASLQPSWFLKDQNGNRIMSKSYPGDYLMDVGNPAYQQACAAHAAALAKADGFDGVFFDGVTAWAGWGFQAGVSSPQYPTPASWQAGMYSYLQTISSQMHANGLLAIANIGGASMTPGLWQKWSALFDGSEEESFTDAGSGVAGSLWTWKSQLANAAWSQANGKYTILHSFNRTETGNTFGVATMLLVGGGNDSYSTDNANYTSSETWYPEYAIAEQLGAPAGAYKQLANGVYERVFAGGMVLVNPTGKAIGQFSLGGGIYSGSGRSNVTAVSMARASALILAG